MGIIALVVVPLAIAAYKTGTGEKLFEHSEYDSIGLCPKDTTTRQCVKYTPEGLYVNSKGKYEPRVHFSVHGETLKIHTEIKRGVSKNSVYQLTLNGPGGTWIDTALASMRDDLWIAGCWNGAYSYNAPCVGNDQGYYNFDMTARPVKRGHQVVLRRDYNLNLPEGIYKGVKFIVKLTSGADGKGGPFTPVMMEKNSLNFVVAKK